MYLPKSDLYSLLKTLSYTVEQHQPIVFTSLPAITFRVGNNSVDLDMDNTIASQDIDIFIDMWADSSVVASQMLSEVEALLRQHGYKLTFSGDIPNPDEGLYHISTRFSTIK